MKNYLLVFALSGLALSAFSQDDRTDDSPPVISPAKGTLTTATGWLKNEAGKKFPGNPTRSYRTSEQLKIVGEATDWPRLTPEQLQKWRERLANNDGEIIN